MGSLARWLARRLWWSMIQLMRRPWMRRIQDRFVGMAPPSRRAKARASIVQQNRLARRHGLRLLAFTLHVLLASVVLTGGYHSVLWLKDAGVLELPEDIRQRAASE